jgi:hypothetical protein
MYTNRIRCELCVLCVMYEAENYYVYEAEFREEQRKRNASQR